MPVEIPSALVAELKGEYVENSIARDPCILMMNHRLALLQSYYSVHEQVS